ncbi:MAG: c-type cytochrome [Candidatus Eisenbacteria bacterium]|nr:c-type cytochrome [Candidatus Latescibacterota bacterium]MBD3302248.1 c-type cytochrome [Candidatus Eisenbacteria bacterium]
MTVPRWILLTTVVLVAVSWIPLALIARDRTARSDAPRMSLIPDMDKQPRYTSQNGNPVFADRRADRRPVDGTVARGRLQTDDRFWRGKTASGEWVERIPMEVDARLLERGRQRFDIYCAPCHGFDGSGDGIVSRRAEALREGTWVPPTSFHTETVRERPDGHLFNSITNGIRNMPAYGHQIDEPDRWAIVAYVRALQRSQNARIEDVPADVRPQLR